MLSGAPSFLVFCCSVDWSFVDLMGSFIVLPAVWWVFNWRCTVSKSNCVRYVDRFSTWAVVWAVRGIRVYCNSPWRKIEFRVVWCLRTSWVLSPTNRLSTLKPTVQLISINLQPFLRANERPSMLCAKRSDRWSFLRVVSQAAHTVDLKHLIRLLIQTFTLDYLSSLEIDFVGHQHNW